MEDINTKKSRYVTFNVEDKYEQSEKGIIPIEKDSDIERYRISSLKLQEKQFPLLVYNFDLKRGDDKEVDEDIITKDKQFNMTNVEKEEEAGLITYQKLNTVVNNGNTKANTVLNPSDKYSPDKSIVKTVDFTRRFGSPALNFKLTERQSKLENARRSFFSDSSPVKTPEKLSENIKTIQTSSKITSNFKETIQSNQSHTESDLAVNGTRVSVNYPPTKREEKPQITSVQQSSIFSTEKLNKIKLKTDQNGTINQLTSNESSGTIALGKEINKPNEPIERNTKDRRDFNFGRGGIGESRQKVIDHPSISITNHSAEQKRKLNLSSSIRQSSLSNQSLNGFSENVKKHQRPTDDDRKDLHFNNFRRGSIEETPQRTVIDLPLISVPKMPTEHEIKINLSLNISQLTQEDLSSSDSSLEAETFKKKINDENRYAYHRRGRSEERPRSRIGSRTSPSLPRTPSEHELRIAKSLEKLDIPDWFKNSSLSNNRERFISSNKPKTFPRWSELRQRSASLSNIHANNKQTTPGALASTSGRVNTSFGSGWRSSSISPHYNNSTSFSRENPRDGQYFRYPSTSSISRCTSPMSSLGGFNYPQQYTGWRSSEQLAKQWATEDDDEDTDQSFANSSSYYKYWSPEERITNAPGYFAMKFGIHPGIFSKRRDGDKTPANFDEQISNLMSPDNFRNSNDEGVASAIDVIDRMMPIERDESLHVDNAPPNVSQSIEDFSKNNESLSQSNENFSQSNESLNQSNTNFNQSNEILNQSYGSFSQSNGSLNQSYGSMNNAFINQSYERQSIQSLQSATSDSIEMEEEMASRKTSNIRVNRPYSPLYKNYRYKVDHRLDENNEELASSSTFFKDLNSIQNDWNKLDSDDNLFTDWNQFRRNSNSRPLLSSSPIPTFNSATDFQPIIYDLSMIDSSMAVNFGLPPPATKKQDQESELSYSDGKKDTVSGESSADESANESISHSNRPNTNQNFESAQQITKKPIEHLLQDQGSEKMESVEASNVQKENELTLKSLDILKEMTNNNNIITQHADGFAPLLPDQQETYLKLDKKPTINYRPNIYEKMNLSTDEIIISASPSLHQSLITHNKSKAQEPIAPTVEIHAEETHSEPTIPLESSEIITKHDDDVNTDLIQMPTSQQLQKSAGKKDLMEDDESPTSNTLQLLTATAAALTLETEAAQNLKQTIDTPVEFNPTDEALDQSCEEVQSMAVEVASVESWAPNMSQDNLTSYEQSVDLSLGTIVHHIGYAPKTNTSTTFDDTSSVFNDFDTLNDKYSSKQRLRSDWMDETVIVRCAHVGCKKTTELRDARINYKTCRDCYTYYCSHHCRKDDKERHKRQCLHGRSRQVCKMVLKFAQENEETIGQLSAIARDGYFRRDRGCVRITLQNPKAGLKFIRRGIGRMEIPSASYVAITDVNVDELGQEVCSLLQCLCDNYDANRKFVLLVTLFVNKEVVIDGVPHWEQNVIAKCAKVRLAKDRSDEVVRRSRRGSTSSLFSRKSWRWSFG
ncbi:hypothetical protein CHUAL_008379 [Chamberlinius hualienensis]